MVKQDNGMKTSSKRRRRRASPYLFTGSIVADWELIRDPTLVYHQLNIFAEFGQYIIAGHPTGNPVVSTSWKEPPHRYFANLRISRTQEGDLVDPSEMLGFVKRYGFLFRSSEGDEDDQHTGIRYWSQNVEPWTFTEPPRDFSDAGRQEYFIGAALNHSLGLLKYVWKSGDELAIKAIAKSIEPKLQPHVENDGGITIHAGDAWTFICILILRDHAAGKTAICANPECSAPFFVKSRKTQKICELGECVIWAQRKHALKWWHDHRSPKNSNDPLGD